VLRMVDGLIIGNSSTKDERIEDCSVGLRQVFR
jgi:hypothetical protein